MRSELTVNYISKRYGRLVRGVAIFLLLFTGADLTMQQYFCGGEEIGGLPLQRVTLASTASDRDGENNAAAVPTSNDSQPDQPSDKAPCDEDCFCCCAHVLPGLGFASICNSELKSPQKPLEKDFLPSPPLQSTYHPPRFA